MTQTDVAHPRSAGAAQAYAIIIAMTLPVTPLLSLVPNLPQLFRHFADVPHKDVLIPMILTGPSACIALLSPVAGSLIDRFGRRRVLLASVLVYTICGVAPFFLEDLKSILVAQLGVGLGEACILPVCNTLLGDYFQDAQRRRWLGVQAILGSVLATAAVLAGGALGTISWHAPFLVNMLGAVVFVWMSLTIWEPSQAPRRAGVDDIKGFPWREMGPVFLVTTPLAILYFIQAVQLGLMFAQHGGGSSFDLSVLTTIASVGVMAGGWWFRRQNETAPWRLIAIILGAYGVGLIGLGLASSALWALPFGVIAQFGNGLVVPVLLGWALSKLDFRYRGRGMGLWATAFFVGQFAGPAMFAVLVRVQGGDFLRTVALVGGFCCAAAVVTFWLARRRRSASSA